MNILSAFSLLTPLFCICSETNLKKAPGNMLAKATSLPGKNGNPTFAAVAAGYDRSPGERDNILLSAVFGEGVFMTHLHLICDSFVFDKMRIVT